MEISIIILGIYILLCGIGLLLSWSYSSVSKMVEKAKEDTDVPDSSLPPMSILITTHDQYESLRQNLRSFLEQDYPAGFEVIVVDTGSIDETIPYLNSIKDVYPNLHVSITPTTARNVSPMRLALTLGIRAASHDWVVLTQANCQPATPNWLTRLAQCCSKDEGRQIVLGHTIFVNGKRWHGLRCRFFRSWQQLLHLPYASRHGAYRCDGTNFCYRRSLFLQHKGFADDANLLVGATDIMVNRHSTKENTAVCLHPDAFMLQSSPRYLRWWYQERLFFMETRRHFHRRFLYRLKYLIYMLWPWIFTFATAGAVVANVLWQPNYIFLAIIAVLWLTHGLYRAQFINRSFKALQERSVILTLPLLLHLVLLWDTFARCQWVLTKRKTFQKKFI